ncbi:MAG: pilin [Patescibacteria group bacterium]
MVIISFRKVFSFVIFCLLLVGAFSTHAYALCTDVGGRFKKPQVGPPPWVWSPAGVGCTKDADCHGDIDCGPTYSCNSGADYNITTGADNYCVEPLGTSKLDKIGGYDPTGTGLRDLINNATLAVGVIAGLIFFAMLVMGGIAYMTAGGDEKLLTKAKQQITAGLIGLVIVFMAWWVVKIIGIIFGINILQPSFKGP